ncbi:hypothetical protein Tco_0276613 [Tanacetum coccineum]
MNTTTAFLRGEVAVVNQSRKKALPAWKHHEASHKPNFDKRLDFKNRHKPNRSQDRFTPFIKTPKEILAIEMVKFKAPPPMSGPTESRNKNKFCEFHGYKGHNTDECIHLRKHIEEAVKSGQLSHLIKELKQGEVEGHLIHRIYVDGGFASEVLYEHCFNRLRPEIKSRMNPTTTLLLGFNEEISWSLGQISLIVSLGDGEHSTSDWMNFMVIRSPSPYNEGIITLRSSPIIPVECIMLTEASNEPSPNELVISERIKVSIHLEYLEQTVTIGERLLEKERMELCDLLRNNLDIFGWKLPDMIGIPRSVSEHRLNIYEGCPPIRHKRRGQEPDRNKAIQEEVAKLVEAQITREVHYHSWLSNPFMVKKHDGS